MTNITDISNIQGSSADIAGLIGAAMEGTINIENATISGNY